MDAQEIKQLKELQDAYLSVYEAKKVDKDEDGEMYESYLDEGLRQRLSKGALSIAKDFSWESKIKKF